MQKHISIKVSGRVQGVYYRASTHEEAQRLGLKGFVKNEPDGSVYIEAEGDDAVLNALVAWCKQGPPAAHVTNVEIEEGTWKGFTEFAVKR
jgi:acylphosphatase